MKNARENTSKRALWRRALAFLIALSLVLIPVHFPGLAKGAEGDASLPNYMTDKFGNASYATDVVYQWVKSANVSLTTDGYLNFAGNKESAVITALKKDPVDSSKTTDIAQQWTDYTVEARLNRTDAPGNNYMAGLVARVSQDENGLYSYYVLMVKGGTTQLYKVVGATSTQQYVPNDPLGISLKLGTSGTAPSTNNQWMDVKLVVKDATIQCYINGTLSLEYTDDQGLGGDPLLKGSAGVYKQASGWSAAVDSFKVTHEDNSTAFYDDFSDSRYIDGVTYKWGQEAVVTPTFFKWEPSFANGSSYAVNDGKLTFSVVQADKQGKNYLYLFGSDEGAAAATVPYAWDNYSVQVDYTVNKKSETDADPVGETHLFGRVTSVYDGGAFKGYTYYDLMMKGNNLYLNKYYYNSGSIVKYQAIATSATVPKGTTVTMKLSFNGHEVSAYILDQNGTQLNPANQTTYVDDGSKGDVITSGGIGMQATHAFKWIDGVAHYYDWSVSYDNLKVNMLDGTEVFADDFSTSDYFAGKTTDPGDAVAEAWDVDYKWRGYSGRGESDTTYVKISNDFGGTLWMNGAVNRFDAVLSGTAQNGTVDVTKYWTDYALEARINRSQAPATNYMAGVLGKVSKDSNGKYSYYAIMLKGKSANAVASTNIAAESDKLTVQVYRVTGAANTYQALPGSFAAIGENASVTGTGGKAANEWTDLKVVFSGAEIMVYIDGDLAVSVTDPNPLPGGSVGIHKQANWQNVSGDTAAANRHYWADSLKVTLADGQVVYETDFTPTEEEITTPSKFFTTAKTREGAFIPTKWSVANGAYTVSSLQPTLNLFSAVSGENDYAQSWADYAVDANIMLSTDDAWGSLIANAVDSKFYELRVEKTKASLYQVVGTTETLLATEDLELSTNTWYFTKLEVDGDGTSLKGYVDGALTVEYAFEEGNAAAAFAAGAPGLRAYSSAKFDDMVVYPVELSDSREFAFYDFEVAGMDELEANWIVEDNTKWKLVKNTLVYEDADPAVVGVFQLRKKATLDNYNAEVSVTTAAAGEIGVLGRYNVAADSYYKLALDLEDGLTLYKVTAGVPVELDSVSVEDLYLMGLQVKANTGYVLRLHMYQDTIQGYINGVRVLSAEDAEFFTDGITALSATNGGAFVSLLTTEALEPAALSVVDENGNVVGTQDAPMQIPQGKIPNLVYLFLKEGEGEAAKLIPVDTLEVSELDGTTLGAKTATIKYDGRDVTLHYTVIDRTAAIDQLNSAIAALNVSALTLNDAAAVNALAKQYDDLSYIEKEKVSADNKTKLAQAEEAILVLKYPDLAGTNVVFADDFDTAASEDQYTNDYMITSQWDRGEWFIRNGEMYQYTPYTVKQPTSFTCSNMLKNRDFTVTSISVDVQIIDDMAWAGIYFHDYNNEYYSFVITDKSNRIQFSKNTGSATTIKANDIDKDFDFEKGNWYNLRVVLVDGVAKCYVDDVLWITYTDVETVSGDEILTHGAIHLRASENWVKFDNLEVRGVENEWVDEIIVSTNPNLTPGAYADDFADETAGKDPSHWIEISTEDQWLVKAEGENLFYGSTGHTKDNSQTWLHVFETDVDYAAKLRVTAKGDYPIAALVARLNADTSYIRAGYDFTLQKWFIATRFGQDFEEVVTYAAEKDTAVDFSNWVALRVKVVGSNVELYCGETKVLTADAGRKVSPGRVGVYTEQCDVDVDDVDVQLLSGQGRVNDGVLEYYTAQAGANSGTLFQVTELGDGTLLLHQDSTQYTSTDGGKTWVSDSTYYKAGFQGGSTLVLHDGSILNVKSFKTARRSDDGGKTWTVVGEIDWGTASYSQPAEHLSEVQLADGTWRIFFTAGNQKTESDGIVSRKVISEVFYSDDRGATWTKSENSPQNTTNLDCFAESHVLAITKDVTDAIGNQIPAGTLVHYSTYNSADNMRYSLSFDGGKTWEGDYAMPDIPCGWNSMTIEQDLETGTYYMATFFNVPSAIAYGFPRLRVVLLSSDDGLNWNFEADVDRWGDVSDADGGHLMQGVNMYLGITKDYIFVSFSRSEAFSSSGSHNLQVGRVYRFEKAKLDAYDVWPEEYVIPAKTIIAIDVIPADEYTVNGEVGGQIKVYYYDGTTDIVDIAEAFITTPDMSTVGEKKIVVDYKHFRDILTAEVVLGKAPVIADVEDGKTYCGQQVITITDPNNDLASVTLNGNVTSLQNGKLVILAGEEIAEHVIVATDKAGNSTTVAIKVHPAHKGGTATCEDKAICEACGEAYGELAAHKGGTATCTDKAKCEVCGEAYGELNADNHTKEAKWTITADKHSKAYECCGAVVVAEAAHKGGSATCEAKAKCEVCEAEYGELAAHKGGEATCTDKAKCEVCEKAYGELAADNHTKEAKWTITADKHSKAYECCGKVVVAEEAHEWKNGKCEECGYEAEVGSEQKPIEVTDDKKPEKAEVAAGEEVHYELGKDLAGQTITVKGEDAYVIVDGKKYEAKDGVVEVKLPSKDAAISVVIGNAGAAAGSFSISIAVPSDSADTGDNSALVLFGALLAVSALAAGVLLIPDIRKRLIK